MDDLAKPRKAELAIGHALQQIRDLPEFGYEAGVGTQTFALLTEALAAILGAPVDKIRRMYAPRRAAPRGQDDTKRLDWLLCRLEEMPVEFPALLGLAGFGSGPREAIDRAMAREGGQS